MKYELRWLTRNTGKTLMNELGFHYDETVRVLQYRVYYDATIYAGRGPHGDFAKQMIWSAWKDVPEVTEP